MPNLTNTYFYPVPVEDLPRYTGNVIRKRSRRT